MHARASFETRHTDEAWRFLEDAYGAGLNMRGRPRRVRLERLESSALAIDEMSIEASFSYGTDPLPRLTVIQVRGGWCELERTGHADRFGPGDIGVTAPPGTGFAGDARDVRLRVVGVDLDAVDAAVADLRGREVSSGVTFRSFRPRDGAAGAQWSRLIDYLVADALHDSPAVDGSLVEGAVTRLVAHHALACFDVAIAGGSSLRGEARDRHDAAVPGSLRRAIAFMHSEVDRDLSVAEIAAVARVTPRALQYAFRRAYGVSPMRYLHRLRLDLAHQELREPDASTTVGNVAARWGFYNAGRFSREYRGQYGELPSETLRDARE